MICPAVLITWPQHIDFPILRYNLIRFRPLFKDIFICFTNENQPVNYRDFVIHRLPFARFTKPDYRKEDWRDDTVNSMLHLTTDADYYLFLEPDFLIRDTEVLKKIFSSDRNFIYYEEGERIHPAFAIVKRDLIDRTSLDFAAHPPEGDHFVRFFREVSAQDEGISLRQFGLKEREDYYHMAGLTQNYACYDRGEPLYKPQEFVWYNSLSMLLPYQQMTFYKKQYDISEEIGFTKHVNFLTKFFPEE